MWGGARAEVITKQAYPWKDFNCVLCTEERPLKTHGHIQIVTVEQSKDKVDGVRINTIVHTCGTR